MPSEAMRRCGWVLFVFVVKLEDRRVGIVVVRLCGSVVGGMEVAVE